jgi:hypothetical protein
MTVATHAIVPVQQAPAFQLTEIEKIATSIARGGLFGSKDPYAVLTLCLLAQAEGQHPAVVFRDYDLIQGKPAKKAEAMLRDFIGGGGKVTWNRLDDECAEAVFSHPQGGEVTINWTLDRAKTAGLGGKDMWKKYPRQMLRSRVVSEGVRTVYPNATSGLYVPEEVRDMTADKMPSDTPPTPEAKRARDLKPEPKQIEAQAEEPTTNGNRAKAEAWVAGYEAELRAAPDMEAYMAVQAKAEKPLAKLFEQHPDLYARALNLGTELAPAEAGDIFQAETEGS